MPRSKDSDEVFCTSCGEPIKKEAEICPHCGVRNKNVIQSQRSSGQSGQQQAASVSSNWWYGVAGGTVLWVLLVVLVGVDPSPPYDAFLGFLLVLAWIGLPLAAYFDMQYVRTHSNWQPNIALWVIALAIWFLNILFGAVYLIRRHENLDIP